MIVRSSVNSYPDKYILIGKYGHPVVSSAYLPFPGMEFA
jgi:hypothetical protein